MKKFPNLVVEEFSLMDKIAGFYWLTRPLNSSTAAVAVVVALHMGISNKNQVLFPMTYLFVGLAAFFVTAHSMVHNDIVDFDIDKINSPLRSIPSGKVSMRQAKIWSLFLMIFALIFALFIDLDLNLDFPFSIFWAFTNMMILDFYNLRLKRSGLFGNLIIGYVTAALFLYADIILNQKLTLQTESIGLYAFFLVWGREVFKDIIDIEGDKAHGMRTIPVIFGPRKGAIAGSVIIFIGVLWSFPLIFSPNFSIVVSIILGILDFLIVYWCIRMIQDPTKERSFATKLLLLKVLFIALLVLAINQFVRIYIN